MKLKMLFYSFTRSALQRKPVDNMAELLKNLCLTEGDFRPIFYVSNSPWNIYDFICKFMNHYDFPEGPIFLRDYGCQLIRRKKTDPIHKLETIGKLFDTLSDFTFILIGDSSEKDFDHYVALSEQYPNRVEYIFIRDVGMKGKRNRILSKMGQHNTKIDIRLNADVREFYLTSNKSME
jgi:phosphatidate phosphatase APP1